MTRNNWAVPTLNETQTLMNATKSHLNQTPSLVYVLIYAARGSSGDTIVPKHTHHRK